MHQLNPVELTSDGGFTYDEIASALAESLKDKESLNKVLLVAPDLTRAHSEGGKICNIYYHMLKDFCQVEILIASGTHVEMSKEEYAKMFGDIPYSTFIPHNWRTDVVKIGEAPKEYVEEISEGTFSQTVEFEVNRKILDSSYDLIISVGQVVPHEVVGMANYTKNLLVGCGGSAIINASHILGAFYGMERIMGRDFSPVRKLFDYAQDKFFADLPIYYVLTVTTAVHNDISVHGLFIGKERDKFEKAVSLSQSKNMIFTDEPLDKVVVYLDPEEFKSTWLGNKSIYRTRMAIADEGELIIIAPGVERFGEDDDIDKLIRKYGYRGREYVIDCCDKYEDINGNLSAAAHLIHGSSDGRFSITYCPGHLSEKEVTDVGFNYMSTEDALAKYDITKFKDGFNQANGEKIYYISNPALGLWADKSKFE